MALHTFHIPGWRASPPSLASAALSRREREMWRALRATSTVDQRTSLGNIIKFQSFAKQAMPYSQPACTVGAVEQDFGQIVAVARVTRWPGS